MKRLHIGQPDVEIGDDYVITYWPDGTELHAVAVTSDIEVARAHALGYDGDVNAMTRDHDVLHHVLAHARGWWHSNAIWDAAHGAPQGPGVDDEERIVLLIQRLLNVGIDGVLKDFG